MPIDFQEDAKIDFVADEPERKEMPPVKLSPYETAKLETGYSQTGTFGPAHPEEVLLLPEIAKIPGAVLEPVATAASDVASEFLRRTGIDPNATPGKPIVSLRSIPNVSPGGVLLKTVAPKLAAGLESGAGEVVSGFTEPGQLLMLPAAAALKPMGALYGASMLGAVPESAQAAIESKTPEERGRAIAQTAAELGMAYGLFRGLPERPEQVARIQPPAIPKWQGPIATGEVLPVQKGVARPDPRLTALIEEGVKRTDAEALLAGKMTVKQVVDKNMGIVTPTRDFSYLAEHPESEFGHADAMAEGYSMALARLERIMGFDKVQPAPESKPPPVKVEAELSPVPKPKRPTKLKPGFVRLWRGGTAGQEGNWFSDTKEVGEFHFENHAYDKPATLSYIDIPEADAFGYSEAAFSHPDVLSGKTIAEGGDHVLPPELAAKAIVVKVSKPKPPQSVVGKAEPSSIPTPAPEAEVKAQAGVAAPAEQAIAQGKAPSGKAQPVGIPARNWELFSENLAADLDAFSPARDTGRVNYELQDVADRFVDYAKADTSGKPLDKLVSDFAKVDEATDSQIRKLRSSVKSVLASEKPTQASSAPATEPPKTQPTPSPAPPVEPAKVKAKEQPPAPPIQRDGEGGGGDRFQTSDS